MVGTWIRYPLALRALPLAGGEILQVIGISLKECAFSPPPGEMSRSDRGVLRAIRNLL